MKLDYNKNVQYLQVDDDDLVSLSGSSLNYPYSVLVTRMGYKRYSLEGKRIIILNSVLQKEFEPVEDFTYVEYAKPKKEFVSYTQIYKKKDENFFIAVDIDLQHEWEDDHEIYEDGKYKVIDLYYDTADPDACAKCVDSMNKHTTVNNDSSSKITVVLKTTSGFNFKEHRIDPLSVDIDKMYNDSFKPVHSHIVDSLQNNSKGVVMLHGKAGTGKTNYIKHLTTLVPNKRFIFIPVSVIPHLTDPSFLGQLIDNKGCILVLEDCENYLKDRNTTGENSVVSTILNLSDGILSDVLGIQIICTFNANLRKIDEALLRKGRLIDEYDFDSLDVDKAQNIMDDLKVDYKVTQPMTLAEIYNVKDESHRSEVKSGKIGFNR